MSTVNPALKKPTAKRSGRWRAVEKRHLAAHPRCIVCGTTKFLRVHHVRPYHVYPELELEPTNLVTLCQSPWHNCHLYVGHLGDYKSWNPAVKSDARMWAKKMKQRPYPEPKKAKGP